MKTHAIIGILAIALSASAASAQPDGLQGVSVIGRSTGPSVHMYGPDQSGRYMLRIEVADLDLSTPEGQRTIAQRVELGAEQLCAANADGGDLPGYYNASKRACISDARADARAQLAGRSGASVANLDITGSVAQR